VALSRFPAVKSCSQGSLPSFFASESPYSRARTVTRATLMAYGEIRIVLVSV